MTSANLFWFSLYVNLQFVWSGIGKISLQPLWYSVSSVKSPKTDLIMVRNFRCHHSFVVHFDFREFGRKLAELNQRGTGNVVIVMAAVQPSATATLVSDGCDHPFPAVHNVTVATRTGSGQFQWRHLLSWGITLRLSCKLKWHHLLICAKKSHFFT